MGLLTCIVLSRSTARGHDLTAVAFFDMKVFSRIARKWLSNTVESLRSRCPLVHSAPRKVTQSKTVISRYVSGLNHPVLMIKGKFT